VTSTSAAGPIGLDSVWKWDGKYWMRTATLPATRAATAIIRCSADYMFDKTVFLADTNIATRLIYRSNDYGMWFKPQITLVPTPFDGAMLVLSSSSIIVGVGNNVYITKNNGTSWDPATTLVNATAPIVSIAKSPAYSTDNTLLLGDSSNRVFISKDQGLNWAQVPSTAQVSTSTTAPTAVNVGFDSAYATNNYIYAALAGTDRVYRINAATGTSWSTIDGTPAQAGVITAARLSPESRCRLTGRCMLLPSRQPVLPVR